MHFDPSFFVALPGFVLSVMVHEWAHAATAAWCGDPTARERGYLSLDPARYFDPVGSALVPGVLFALRAPFLFGWARPAPVERGRLRDPRNGPVLVALAGPAANLMLAVACAAIARLFQAAGSSAPLAAVAISGVLWNCALTVYNLVPLPPLDGSWVLMRFLRLRHIVALHALRLPIALALLVTALLPGPGRALLLATPRLLARACLTAFGVAG